MGLGEKLGKLWGLGGPPEGTVASEPAPGRGGDPGRVFTFSATRVNARHVEDHLRQVAEAHGLGYEAELGSGLVLREIVVTVTGPEDGIVAFDGAAQALLNRGGQGIDGTPGG